MARPPAFVSNVLSVAWCPIQGMVECRFYPRRCKSKKASRAFRPTRQNPKNQMKTILYPGEFQHIGVSIATTGVLEMHKCIIHGDDAPVF